MVGWAIDLVETHLNDFVRTLLTTRNFWRVPEWMLDPNKRMIILFYGYPPMNCNFSQYYRLRNSICNGYKILKSNNESYSLTFGNGYVLSGDNQILSATSEDHEKYYHIFNYAGKTVLDVGGFMGDTAVLFASWGAKKIIVYEPVPENAKWAEANVKANNVYAEIHVEGLGDKNGETKIRYDNIEGDFGLRNSGKNVMTIKLRNASEIISASNADIAKIDCEGGERYLLTVPEHVLRLIPKWIIECHDYKMLQALQQKFETAGFETVERKRERDDMFFLGFILKT